jgi:hypothetical protein
MKASNLVRSLQQVAKVSIQMRCRIWQVNRLTQSRSARHSIASRIALSAISQPAKVCTKERSSTNGTGTPMCS